MSMATVPVSARAATKPRRGRAGGGPRADARRVAGARLARPPIGDYSVEIEGSVCWLMGTDITKFACGSAASSPIRAASSSCPVACSSFA